MKNFSSVPGSKSGQHRTTPGTSDKPFLIEGPNLGHGRQVNHRPLHELFEEVASTRPLAVALTYGGADVNYQELNRRANRVAHRLRRLGIGPESLVAISAGRSVEFIIGVLAIIKAGGAYVPLDMSYPRERLNFMLRDTHPSVLIGGSDEVQLDAPWAHQLTLTADVRAFLGESEENLHGGVKLRNAAYVMYTSGSTGQPKGVVVEQRSIVRLVIHPDYITITPRDTFLQLAPTSFDASTLEIWGSLLNGARLVIMPSGKPSLREIGKMIEDEKVTTLWLTAGLFHAMVDEQLGSLATVRNMLAGGDILSPTHVERFLNAHRSSVLINGYGPTEGTTFTCCHSVRFGDTVGKAVPIGRPISRTRVLVLDESLNQVSIGETGELYIGGDGVAREYLNQPQLTSEKFIHNPYSTDIGDVLYKSGDLVSIRPDGTLDFLGRKDSQVKIRGFRIELGEIEVCLQQHPAVRHAVALVADENGDKTIHAFWSARAAASATTEQLLQFAGEHLPAYMMPTSLVQLDAIPLTENGKVDRKQLLERATLEASRKMAYVPPSDELEVELIEIWENVLNVNQIGVRDDFFQLGGHSLLAARMFAKVEERLQKSLPLATMFHAPTIEQLAALIRAEGWTPHWSVLVPIQPAGTKPPLFLVHGLFGNVLIFFGLRHHIPHDQPVYGVQAEGLDTGRATALTIPEMASNYIREIRKLQPHGPYFLGGFSAGGLVAFEMAHQLTAAGEQVQLLALLDSFVEVAGGYWLKSFYSKRALRMSLLSLRSTWQGVQQEGLASMARKKFRNMAANFRIVAWEFAGKVINRGSAPDPGTLGPREAFIRAIRIYTPQPYSGSAILFRSPVSIRENDDVSDGWSQYIAGKLERQEIYGGHEDLFKEPHIAGLADQLMQALGAATSKGRQPPRLQVP